VRASFLKVRYLNTFTVNVSCGSRKAHELVLLIPQRYHTSYFIPHIFTAVLPENTGDHIPCLQCIFMLKENFSASAFSSITAFTFVMFLRDVYIKFMAPHFINHNNRYNFK
jgi:hypothetical protein